MRSHAAGLGTVVAMTEGRGDSAASGRPMSTGEFRAAPDVSASTAQFRAFAERKSETTQQWETVAAQRNPARKTFLIIAVILALVIVAVLAATLG